MGFPKESDSGTVESETGRFFNADGDDRADDGRAGSDDDRFVLGGTTL